MGASAWGFFTPYKSNIQEAFENLRESVFSSKQYYRPGEEYPDTFEEAIKMFNLSDDPVHYERRKSDYLAMIEKARILPTSIEHLMALNAESGTHSILDISHITTSTDFDDNGTLPDSEIMKLFGTLKPTRKMIEEKEEQLLRFRGRWMCTYITAYNNEEPTEIFFTGYSGD